MLVSFLGDVAWTLSLAIILIRYVEICYMTHDFVVHRIRKYYLMCDVFLLGIFESFSTMHNLSRPACTYSVLRLLSFGSFFLSIFCNRITIAN